MEESKQTSYTQAIFWVVLGIIGLCLALFGCTNKPDMSPERAVEDRQRRAEQRLQVVTYDGCEYLTHELNYGYKEGIYTITHKGNCKNSIHKYEQ